jgi:hypothetical protein
VSFFRQAALLLPSAFLIAVLLFLLTHGRQDPGFGTYPFFEQWGSGALVAATPEGRFVEQALLFFLPAYLLTLLLVLFVAMAENGLFGRRDPPGDTGYRRAFRLVYAVLFLAGSGPIVFAGERAAGRIAPGALIAPLLVAVAPWIASALAVLPAALLALPLAGVRRVPS